MTGEGQQSKTIHDVVIPALNHVKDLKDLDIEVIATLIVCLLSDQPETVKVRIEKTPRLTALEFEIEEHNKGRTIGKSGHTIKAIRSVCKSIARSRGKDVQIEIPGYD